MPSNLPRRARSIHGAMGTSHFVDNINKIRKSTQPEVTLFENSDASSGTITSQEYPIAACEFFSIYVYGAGAAVNVQVSMNPSVDADFWTTINTSALNDGDVYEGQGGQHAWVRVQATAGADVTVQLYRRYAAY